MHSGEFLHVLMLIIAADEPRSFGSRLLDWLGTAAAAPFLGGGIFTAIYLAKHEQISEWWKESKESGDADKVHIWNLVSRRKTMKKPNGVTLLQAMNRGAAIA